MQHPPAESGRVAFLLGGQGTQYFGMAHSLLDHDPVFRSTVKSLDGLVSERCERSVLDYLYDPGRGFGDRCDDLLMTNLGLLMVEYALAKSLEERGVRPEVIVGSSLGEFVATAVAGYLPVETVVDFLIGLSECVLTTMPPGGMVAVLSEVDKFHQAVKPNADIEIASVNSAEHFVISADSAALERARRTMSAKRILYQDLPVNFAFHSSAVDAMAADLRDFGKTINTEFPRDGVPIFSSRSGARISEVSAEACWEVVRGPIHFTETVARLPDYRGYRYVDLSPSSSLAATLRGSLPETIRFPIITPFQAEMENIGRIVEECGVRPK